MKEQAYGCGCLIWTVGVFALVIKLGIMGSRNPLPLIPIGLVVGALVMGYLAKDEDENDK